MYTRYEIIIIICDVVVGGGVVDGRVSVRVKQLANGCCENGSVLDRRISSGPLQRTPVWHL